MSCYQCNPDHIAALVEAMRVFEIGIGAADLVALGAPLHIYQRTSCTASWSCHETVEATFRLLWSANHRSVASRYADVEDATVPTMPRVARLHRGPHFGFKSSNAAVAYLKALDCYEYQCMDSADWKAGDPAFDAVQQLRSALIHSLPGYSDAAWGAPVIERAA